MPSIVHITRHHCRACIIHFTVPQVRWAKLRGTPGSGSDKLAEAERDINEADQRVRNAKIAYEEMVSKMTEELNRFQKERAAELNTVMRDFALTQVSTVAGFTGSWVVVGLSTQVACKCRVSHFAFPVLRGCCTVIAAGGC